MRILIPILLAVFLCTNTYAQSSPATLDSLETRYQQCLSESHTMYGCALDYYKQLDSLLYITLQHLYSHIDPSRLQQLRIEQGTWEEKKYEYFKKIDERVEKMHKRTMQGLDDAMISTDNKATYLKDRVAILLHLEIF
ncbi:hypothetical protein [Chitinophaga sp. MM2321]|uniref:hypothetical protein n=1 Tax=Chitinophaga sp. MM2321 TaxID=3137178 RepID=UPI0032D59321